MEVVVATCGRPRELAACLRALLAQTASPGRIVVVDDAPPAAAAVVAAFDVPPLRYIAGRRRGLAAAHNTGLAHVRSDRVAFTDDDVMAAPDWLERLDAAFADGVECVTGRIVAFALETESQRVLEAWAGFDKGAQRRVIAAGDDPLLPFAAGRCGSGANMAFRTGWLRANGGFDEALGAGTRARGGDDLAAFFDVLRSGGRIAYEPAAVVRHRHAADRDELERTVFGYGVGLAAHLTRGALRHPSLIPGALRRARAARAYAAARPALPPPLRRRRRLGMLVGPFAYLASRWAV